MQTWSRRDFVYNSVLAQFAPRLWSSQFAAVAAPIGPSPQAKTTIVGDFLQRSEVDKGSFIVGVDVDLNTLPLIPGNDLFIVADTITVRGAFSTQANVGAKSGDIFIHCRALIAKDAVLDSSGRDGDAPQTDRSDGRAPGASGSPGAPGNPGAQAGSITVNAGSVTGKLKLKANGGNGGRGQDGGNGAKGDIGGEGASHDSDFRNCRGGEQGLPGGRGGDAGAGGKGGDGGAAGSVKVSSRAALGGIEVEAVGGQPGSPGVSGKRGEGGDGGQGGRSGVPHVESVGIRTKPVFTLAGYSSEIAQHGGGGHGPSTRYCESTGRGGRGPQGPFGNEQPDKGAGSNGHSEYLVNGTYNYSACIHRVDRKEFFSTAYFPQLLMLSHSIANEYMAMQPNQQQTLQAQLIWFLDATSESTLGALSPMVSRLQETGASAQEVSSLNAQASALVSQMAAGLDFYGYPYNYVPLISLYHYKADVDEMLKVLLAVETSRDKYQDLTALEADQVAAISIAIDGANKAISSKKTQVAELGRTMNAVQSQVADLNKALSAQRVILQDADETFKQAVNSRSTCGEFLPAIAFVGAVICIATQNYATAAGLVTAIAQAGLAANSIDNIVKNIETASASMGDAAAAFARIKDAALRDDPSSKIVMSEASFDALLAPFMQMDEAKNLRAQIELFVDLAKARNQALLNYTSLAIQESAAASEVAQKTDELQRLQVQMANNSNPLLPSNAIFLTNTARNLKAAVVRAIYNEIRAFNYWSLQINAIAPNDLNAATLKVSQASIISEQETAMTGREGQPLDVTFEINEKTHPTAIASLRKDGLCSFPIRPDQPEFQIGASEIRVNGAWVQLNGASTVSGSLNLYLIHGGNASFMRADGHSITFQHPTRPTQIGYKIDKPESSLTPSITKNLGGSDGPQGDYAWLSPFATWTILASALFNGNQKPDLTKVVSISVRFWGKFVPYNSVTA